MDQLLRSRRNVEVVGQSSGEFGESGVRRKGEQVCLSSEDSREGDGVGEVGA